MTSAATQALIDEARRKAAGGKGKTAPSKKAAEPEPAIAPIPMVEPGAGPTGRSQLEDIGVGAVTGVNKGAAGLFGLPGLAQKLIQMPSRETDLGNLMKMLPQAPTPDETIGMWEDFAGKLPEPETRAGRYAEAVGEFLPGAGGANMLRKVGSASLLGGLSEGGEDVGRLVGGERGAAVGRGAGTVAGLLAPKGPKATILNEAKGIKGVPATAKEAKGLKDTAYGALKTDTQRFDPGRYEQSFLSGMDRLRQEGYNTRNTPAITKFTKQHAPDSSPRLLGQGRQGPRAIEAEVARQKANKMSSSKDIGKSRTGTIMREELDKFHANEVLPNRPDIASNIMEGRLNTRSYKLGKDIEKIVKKGSGAEDVQSALRTRMRTYGANKEEQLPAELNQAIDEFLEKPMLRRGIKQAGSTLRNFANIPMSILGGWHTGGIKGAILGGAIGTGAKLLGHGVKKLQDASDITRADLVKKVALMQPHQRAELMRKLRRTKRGKRELAGENVLLGLSRVSSEE